MNCEKCLELCDTVQIRSPIELRKALDVIDGNLKDGTIEEVKLPNSIFKFNVSFKKMIETNQWPDSISYRFKCSACKQIFLFDVETYHGRGGTWRPE